MDDVFAAHSFSNNHMEMLKRDSVCGCFYCEAIFSPLEITDWIIADNDCDRQGTAICPHCGVDAVIGAYSGYPITKEFLNRMSHRWFGAPERLWKNPLRMDQYLPQMGILMNGLWDFAVEALSWEELGALLREKQKKPSFGVESTSSSSWIQRIPPEKLFTTEYALFDQVLRSSEQEARDAVEAFFRSEPELSPERITILAMRRSGSCPVFLQMMIGPLYGYFIGKVPGEGLHYRVAFAAERWQNHEHPDILGESYRPEYDLLCDLIRAVNDTEFGNGDSEEKLRQAVMAAMEGYVRKPSERKQRLLY